MYVYICAYNIQYDLQISFSTIFDLFNLKLTNFIHAVERWLEQKYFLYSVKIISAIPLC